jgi:hypothetical protein
VHPNLHYPCVEDFVTAIMCGTQPRSSGNTAIVTEWAMGEVVCKNRAVG